MRKTLTLLRNAVVLTFCLIATNATGASTNNVAPAKRSAASTFEGNVISPKGAWCWFADPRALHYENAANTIKNTYIGYIDVHGNIKATQHNFLSGETNEVLIRSYFQPDDHNNPTFLVLPDERVMVFYSRHTDEACFYYRVSRKPGDITTFGDEIKIPTANNTTYPSPFILSDDPNNIYLCWRGINWHPTIAKISIPDAQDKVNVVWGPYQMVQSTAARPYAKYFSNGKDKIFMTYTTGHPDNENPNYVYFNYVDVKTLQLKDVKGTVLSTIANGVHNVSATSTYNNNFPSAVVDNQTFRNWVWQTAIDKDGMPVIAMVQISNDKNTHLYYYAKWTGTTWRKTFLANGGGKFHQTAGLELCYSGGLAIDESNPDIVYCSVPVAGTYGTVYEIFKYTIGADGTVTSTQAVTTNSRLNNSRPYVVTNSGNSPLKLTWMYGNYYDWIVSSTRPQGYPTAIHSEYALPAGNINLANGLVANEDFSGQVTGTARTSGGVLISTKETTATIAAPSATAFSISLTPYIYEGAYNGIILKTGNLTYGLNGSTLKPYVKIGETTYNSTNVLGTSDVWQTQSRGTGGAWYEPTKLKYFNLTLTYANGVLRIFRNGLIDQVIDIPSLTLADVSLGGFMGWIEDCRVYNRGLNQAEVKKLTETSLTYTLNSALMTQIELESLNIPQNIYTDVILPVKTNSGITISWATNNAAVVSASGIVTFPQAITPVSITATISGQSKTFNVSVYPRNIENNKVIAYRFNVDDVYTNNSVKYLRDKSGKGNDAIVYGTAVVNGTFDLSANTATAFSTNGYAMAPNGIVDNLRSCTFLMKVKPSSLTGSPRLFDFGSASSNSIFLRGNAFTAGYKYNGGSTVLINSSTALTAAQEAKVAMTFDARTKTTKIYLNGVETASATTITYEPYQLSGIAATKRNYIGRAQWWDTSEAANNNDYKGTIDDFLVYDIALTATEIAQVQSDVNTGIATPVRNIGFSIFPNPAMRNENIQLSLDIPAGEMQDVKFELINMLGETVQTIRPASSGFSLSGLTQSGIYIIRASSATSNTFYTTRLLVK